MTAILVLTTFAAFFFVEWLMVRRRHRVAAMATSHEMPVARSLADFYFHPGHTWARALDDRLVAVGSSDFASNFAGELSAVELPEQNARLRQGDPAWTLISARNRRLTQAMPVEGKVVAVNRELLKDPSLAQRSPYQNGWILRVRPRHFRDSLRNLVSGRFARAWLDATRDSVAARMNRTVGAVAHDGGEWLNGFGDLLDTKDWDDLRGEIFPTNNNHDQA